MLAHANKKEERGIKKMTKIMSITRMERANGTIVNNGVFAVENFDNEESQKIGIRLAKLGFYYVEPKDIECYVSSILAVHEIKGVFYVKYNVAVCIK